MAYPFEAKIGGEVFSFDGTSLAHNKIPFDDKIAEALPLLTPALTKAVKPRVKQPYVRPTTAAYWESQCILRGLNSQGSTLALQDKIRSSLSSGQAGMRKDLKNALPGLKQSWWNALPDIKARADIDTRRFLEETFKGAPENHAVVVKTNARSKLHQVAEQIGLGLRTHSADAPVDEYGKKPLVDRWIVIGNSNAAVFAKLGEINNEAYRAYETASERRESKNKALQAQVAKTSTLKDGAWDVSGKWSITCEDLRGYGHSSTFDFEMTVHVGFDGKKGQMSADSDFSSVTGIMRFINATEDPAQKPDRKRKRGIQPTRAKGWRAGGRSGFGQRVAVSGSDHDDDDDDGNDTNNEDDFEKQQDNSESQFVLTGRLQPSLQHPKFLFRWRGEETGTGEIQLGSDHKLNSITFNGPGGTECQGTMDISFHGKATFTGRKLQTNSKKINYSAALAVAENGWNSRSAEAYERARVSRW